MFTIHRFRVGIASLFFLSVVLRFWGLDRFNTLVFDEVHFAKFANYYLTHTPFFDNHPPLGKYLIAIGIWIDKLNPLDRGAVNTLTGSPLSPFSYRWMNALVGSLIPLVVVGLAYQLTHRRSYALIAGLFVAADGLFLVESRYALVNVYLIIFGLLGQWFFLLALQRQAKQRNIWLLLSGICFGACASVKWNGLAFLLGTYLIWAIAWAIKWLQPNRIHASNSTISQDGDASSLDAPNVKHFFNNLTQLKLIEIIFDLGLVPVAVYYLIQIPHLQLNSTIGFVELQKQFLGSHQSVSNGPGSHPYCSAWYTWPLSIRPVGYLYQTAQKYVYSQTQSITDPAPSLDSLLPTGVEQVIYDVHGIGNPVLWWLSTAAIAFLLWKLVQRIAAVSSGLINDQGKVLLIQNPDFWIPLYLILNYIANLLPWLEVKRCTFLYHYMGSSVFTFLALAWFVDRWLQSYRLWQRAVGVTVIFLILLAFVYWLPIYLGLPLSPEGFHSRIWFRSWY